MPRLTIDGREVGVPAGATLLDACRLLGIEVPTLCWLEECGRITSCMVCLVADRATGQLMPACSAPAREGMVVETASDDVRHARADAVELLLAEHVGDCEAPCRRACPAGMNIPLMIRHIAAGMFREAIATVKEHIALPAVLGRICPAPCEKTCLRSLTNGPVSVCLLKRFAADDDLASPSPWLPERRASNGKRVAVVGAGPAGLAAAWHLLAGGCACTLFDSYGLPGGLLRGGPGEARLPLPVLDAEVDMVRRLGAEFRLSTTVGRDVPFSELTQSFDAVVLATGELGEQQRSAFGLASTAHGFHVRPDTFQTSAPRVFAGGNAVRPGRLAVRSVAHGRVIAHSALQLLAGEEVRGPHRRFDSHMAHVTPEEAAEMMKDADGAPPKAPAGGASSGFAPAEAAAATRRCMQCDCRKPDSCRLRHFADALDAHRHHFDPGARKRFERIRHPSIVYEPGKCIKCGMCVRIAEMSGEPLGLAFTGRGYEVRVDVPFGRPLTEGLQHCADTCVTACPTGALAWKSGEPATEHSP